MIQIFENFKMTQEIQTQHCFVQDFAYT